MACRQRFCDKVSCQIAVWDAHAHKVARQEAACATQCSIGKQAALECQAADHHQRVQDEMAAEQKIAAIVAAQIIFLWYCHQCLFARLARMILQGQQHQAALARLQHKQEYCVRALLAEQHRTNTAAAHAKTIADQANKQHQQAKVAIEDTLQHATTVGLMQQHTATVVDMRQHSPTILQHQQESCAHALHAKDQRKQLDTVRAKAGAAEDNERHHQAKTANCMMMNPTLVPSSSPSPPCPTSYVSVVLSSMGGGTQLSSPLSPIMANITLHPTTSQRKQPQCCHR